MLKPDKVNNTGDGLAISNSMVSITDDKSSTSTNAAEKVINVNALDKGGLSIMKDCAICQQPKIELQDSFLICPECISKLRKLIVRGLQ